MHLAFESAAAPAHQAGADSALAHQAGADSALAHLLGFHHLQLAGIQLYGTARQQRRLLTETIEQRLFWGNALNPLDRRLVAVPSAGGYLLNGIKSC